MVGPNDCISQCLAFKTNKLVHQILVEPNKPCITALMYKTNHVTNPPHLLEEMGNCVPVHKTQDSASDLKCSSDSRTECILIERPVRENSIDTTIPRASSFQEPSISILTCPAKFMAIMYLQPENFDFIEFYCFEYILVTLQVGKSQNLIVKISSVLMVVRTKIK